MALALFGVVGFVVLAQAFVRGGLVVSFDDDVARWMAANAPDAVVRVARVTTYFGGVFGVVVGVAIAVAGLLRAGQRTDAVFVVVAVAGILIIVPVLKAVYERARPDEGSAIPLPHTYSFPSGHAATAVVLYGALGVLLATRARSRRWAAGWLLAAIVTALAVGASRVILNVHFVSDVVAGFAVGLAWLCVCLVVRDVVRSDPVRATPVSPS